MAESERYLPSLLDTIEEILNEAGLREEDIVIRMSGCPNGCSRAPLAEIAFIGKAPGKYNLYLGGGFTGERLNKLYRENIGEEEIISALTPIFHDYAANLYSQVWIFMSYKFQYSKYKRHLGDSSRCARLV